MKRRQPFQSERGWLLPLTRGQSALLDPADVEWASGWNWHCAPDKGRLVAHRREGKNGPLVQMSRALAERWGWYLVGHYVHQVGEALDYRSQSLELRPIGCTRPRRIAISSGLDASVELTQGYFSTIEARCADLANRYYWLPEISTDHFHADGTPHIRAFTRVDGHRLYLSRYLYSACVGPIPSGMFVDHEDGDTLNDRLANLRLATPKQNAANSRTKRISRTQVKGVAFMPDCTHRPYLAHLNGKGLGSYATIEEAHAVYCDAAREIYGDFARFA